MDPELEAIRARRMAEMQEKSGGGKQPSQQPSQEQLQQMEEQRKTLLMQVLTNEARERLSRVSMVKPEKARSIEDYLLNMAKSGQLGGKVTEEQLISMLEQISSQETTTKTKIVYSNRRRDDDDFDVEDLI